MKRDWGKRIFSALLAVTLLIADILPGFTLAAETVTEPTASETEAAEYIVTEAKETSAPVTEGTTSPAEQETEEPKGTTTPTEQVAEETEDTTAPAETEAETLPMDVSQEAAYSVAASGDCGDDLTWELDENGVLTISGTGDMWSSVWDDYRTSIKTIVIEEGVTGIAYRAFYNFDSLTSVFIPESMTRIGIAAFEDCIRLTDVYIEDIAAWLKMTFVGYDSNPLRVNDLPKKLYIKGESLTDLVIPDGTTTIDGYEFYTCSNFTSLTIPDSVTSIGEYAFYGCTGLTSVTISDSVTTISRFAFRGCTSLTDVMIPGNVATIGTHAFYGCTGLTSVTISGSVATIGTHAFYGCTGLTSVTISNGVTAIGEYMFSGCTSLKRVTIPDSVTRIEYSAFEDCDSLTDVYIEDIAAWLKITFRGYGSNPLYVNDLPKKLYLKGELLTDLVIPDGTTTIGSYAFYTCSSLKSVTIPDSVTGIGDSAFYGCAGLTSVTIPASVTSIGESAFDACASLTDVYIEDIAAWLKITFKRRASPLCANYLPKKLYVQGKLLTDLVIPDGVIIIDDAFYTCSSLESVTIPAGVTSIGNSAFYDCISLTSVTIPASVDTIGTYAFYGCDSLMDVYIEDIAAWLKITFEDYSSNPLFANDYAKRLYLKGNLVKELVIPAGATKIADTAFYSCSSLTSIIIPDSVTSIGIYAFYRCDNLKNVTIPDSVTAIGDYAFHNCIGLENVTIPDSVTTIADFLFAGCTSLMSVAIPDSVATVGDYAFDGCTSLMSVTIPDSVTTIGAGAFSICTGLTSVTIPDSVTTIGDSAFSSCFELRSVTIPASVVRVGDYLFGGCWNLWHVLYTGSRAQWDSLMVRNMEQFEDATVHCEATGDEISTSGADACTDEITFKCAICGDSCKIELDSTAHTTVIQNAVVPTCTENGLTEGKYCSVCGKVFTEQTVIPAPGHSKVIDKGFEATCTENGMSDGAHCVVCREVLIKQEEIPATGHTYTVENGSITCAACGDFQSIRILQDYLTLDLQEIRQAQLALEVEPAHLADDIQWSVEGDEGIVSVDQKGVITAQGVGTAYVIATLKKDELEVNARCRVDVTEDMELQSVQLSTTKLTSELFSTNYAQLEILLQLPQNYPAAGGALTVSQSAAMAAAGMEDGGVSVQKAEFVNSDMKDLFELVMLDDRRAAVVPTEYAVANPGLVAKSYTSAVRITIGENTYDSEELTLTVKKKLPKLKVTIPAFNSFYSGQRQSIAVTGGTVERIETVLPNWLMLEGTDLILTDAAPAKSTSAKLNLKIYTEEWRVPAEVTATVKNTCKVPGIKLAASSVTVVDTKGSAGVELKLLCTNKKDKLEDLKISGVIASAGYSVENLDAAAGTFTLRAGNGFQPGKVELKVSYGSVTKTLKLTVKVQAVKLKLSASKVSLNKYLGDVASVSVTSLTGGYTVTDPVLTYDNTKLDVQYAGGKLSIRLKDGAEYGKTYPVEIRAYEGAPVVKLKAAVLKQNAVVKSTIKATGTLDVIREGTAITIKPAYTNVWNVDVDQDAVLKLYSSADKFKAPIAEVKAENGIYVIDHSLIRDHSIKYKAQLETGIADGKSVVKSNMISLSVKMGSAKLTLKTSGTTMFTRDKNDRALIWFEAADATLNGVAKIAIKDAKYQGVFEVIDYGNGVYAIGFKNRNVDKSLIATGKATSKTVTVTLNVYMDGNETAKANTTAKVKLTIVK